MTPEDFEALVRLVPDKVLGEYGNIITAEELRRLPPTLFSAAPFRPDKWSERILDEYKKQTMLRKLLDITKSAEKKFFKF